MNRNEAFDESARRKLEERSFPYDEANWNAMQRLLRSEKRHRRGASVRRFTAALILLLAGIAAWLLIDRRPAPLAESRAIEATTIGPEKPGVVGPAMVRPAGPEGGSVPADGPAPNADQNVTGPSVPVVPAVPGTASTVDAARNSPRPEPDARTAMTRERMPTPASLAVLVREGSADDAPVETSVERTGGSGPDEQRIAAARDDQRPTTIGQGDGTVTISEMGTAPPSRTEATGAAEPTLDVRPAAVDQSTSTQAGPSTATAAPDAVPSTAGPRTSTTITADQPPIPSDSTAPAPTTSAFVPPARWVELSALGGVMWTNTTYGGSAAGAFDGSITESTSPSLGLEWMHLRENWGYGIGLHAIRYAEKLSLDEQTSPHTELFYTHTFNPVDTTVLIVIDTVVVDSTTYYVTQGVNTTIYVMDTQVDSTTTTIVTREALERTNRVSYLEIPLLGDVHTAGARWRLGLRAGPTIGIMTSRQGALPVGPGGSLVALEDQPLTSVTIGYVARPYLRYMTSKGWSFGLEPCLRGQLFDTHEDGDLSRRSNAMGLMLGVGYRIE